MHNISPPTLTARAEWSDITPLGVEIINMPSPLRFVGISVTEEYIRQPGLDTLLISRIAGTPSKYFNSIEIEIKLQQKPLAGLERAARLRQLGLRAGRVSSSRC